MLVRVLYFASLRERLGIEEEEVELDDGCRVADLLGLLRARGELWQELLAAEASFGVALNQEFAAASAALAAGDEVGLFPPITGG